MPYFDCTVSCSSMNSWLTCILPYNFIIACTLMLNYIKLCHSTLAISAIHQPPHRTHDTWKLVQDEQQPGNNTYYQKTNFNLQMTSGSSQTSANAHTRAIRCHFKQTEDISHIIRKHTNKQDAPYQESFSKPRSLDNKNPVQTIVRQTKNNAHQPPLCNLCKAHPVGCTANKWEGGNSPPVRNTGGFPCFKTQLCPIIWDQSDTGVHRSRQDDYGV